MLVDGVMAYERGCIDSWTADQVLQGKSTTKYSPEMLDFPLTLFVVVL